MKRQKKVPVIASMVYSIKRFSKLRRHKVKSQSDEGNYSCHRSLWIPLRNMDYQQLTIRSRNIVHRLCPSYFTFAEFVLVSTTLLLLLLLLLALLSLY